jgi:plastocyanin
MMYPMEFVLKVFPAVLAGLVLVSSCGGSKPDEKKAEAPPAAASDPAAVATVTGRVTFAGQKPASKTISMDAVPACASQHKGPILVEDTVVNSNGTLKNVFVYLKAGLPSRQWPVPQTPVALDQKGCIYSPRVLGIMVGQDLDISNSDPSMHNVHPMPKNNKEWNSSQAPKGEKMTKQFDKEDIMIPFKCNVHPWMRAYVGVVSHPFFAVTGDDGSFSLKGLPPGDYTLEAWHEKLGTQQIKVSVAAKDSKTADFAFKN